MRHPRRAAIALVFPLLALAACGDDAPVDGAAGTLPPVGSPAPPDPDAAPDRSDAPARSYDVATGADDVVVSITHEGGFVPAGSAFVNTPVALITGDGRALSTGPVIAIFPGPLLPNVQQRSISPAGVQELLARADELGLLGDQTYEDDEMIADAGTTIVTITVGGTIYRHEAYALGMDTETEPARKALADFVAAATDLPATVGDDELGPEEPFTSDEFLIQALPVDRAVIGNDGVEPTFVPWPADAPVRLADAESCATVPAAAFAPLFTDATTMTFFTESDGTDGAETTYSVTPVPQLPGRSC